MPPLKPAFFAFCLGATAYTPSGPIQKSSPRTDLPLPQFTISTSWWSNNPEVPQAQLLRAAARSCGVPKGTNLPHSGVHGLFGTWMLDFACPKAPL
jgi:hypothetical protein